MTQWATPIPITSRASCGARKKSYIYWQKCSKFYEVALPRTSNSTLSLKELLSELEKLKKWGRFPLGLILHWEDTAVGHGSSSFWEISNFSTSVMHRNLRIADWGLRTEKWGFEDWGLRTEDRGLRIEDWGLQTEDQPVCNNLCQPTQRNTYIFQTVQLWK